MATTPLDPTNPTGAQVVDNMALQPPATSGQPDSLAGTMVQGPNLNEPKGVTQPAVVTSANARKQTTSNIQQLRDIQERLNALQAQAQAEEAAKAAADKATATDDAIAGAAGVPAGPVKSEGQIQAEQELADLKAQGERLQMTLDAQSAENISLINDEFDALLRQQEKLNESYRKGLITEGLVSGRARYAPLIQSGIIKAAVNEGMQKLADLQVKKRRSILDAQSAKTANDLKLFNSKMDNTRDIIKQERELSQQTYENAILAGREARDILKFEMDMTNDQIKQTETIAEGVAENYSMMVANSGQEAADDYINRVANNLGLPAAYLSSNVQKTLASRRQTEKTAVLSLAKDYPDVNILATDSIDEAAKKVRGSKIYKNDILKSELAIANTRSLIGGRQSDSNIDYSDGIFQLYSNATGQLVSSPNTARAVQGYATSILGERQVISDSQTVTDPQTQIKNSDAEKLLTDAFSKFAAARAKTAAAWAWTTTPEAMVMSDEEKANYIKEKFGINPEDIGVW